MANTLSVMVRNIVSKKRRRYTEGGYNLDLTYICNNIIAMGYPGENIQSVFRNPMGDVCQFFEAMHKEHYKVYNLRSERAYDANKFHGRVSVYAFEDHNPPTIELILKFCIDVDHWLKADPHNVAAIHCKAGKGRTGTMICCYLLHSGIKTTAEDALAYYGEKRTMNKKGVTIPSQRRYVQYYARLLRSNLKYERRTIQLCEIRFSAAPILQGSSVQCLISIMEEIDCTENRTSRVHDIDPTESWTKVRVKELNKFQIDFRKTFTLELYEPLLLVEGDVKIELKKIFHFWLNSYFVCDTAEYEGEGEDMKLIYTLPKWELDDAHKDKEHKLFPEDFKVQLVLKPVPHHSRNNIDGSEITQLRQHNNHNNHVNSLMHNSHNNANMLAMPASAPNKSGEPTLDAYNKFNHKIERSRKPTSMQQLSPLCSGGIAGGSSYVHANHTHNMVQQRHQQPQKRSSEQMPSVNPESINRSNNKNHNNSNHHQQQQQQQQQHTHHRHHHQHHLHHEQQQKLLQQQQHQHQNQQQLQSQQNNKCSTSSSNIHNTSSNSNSSSSSSISSQSTTSSSSAGVDGGGGDGGGVGEEEDWESGESSTTTTTTSTTTTPTTTSHFPYKRLISSQNDDDDDDNSNKNVKHDDDDDNDDGGTDCIIKPSTSTHTTNITNTTITTTTTSVLPIRASIKDTEGKSFFMYTINDDVNEGNIISDSHPTPNPSILPQSNPLSTNGLHQAYALPMCITTTPKRAHHIKFFHKKCHETPCSESSKPKASSTKCITARDKFLKLINPPRFKAKTISPGMGSSLALNSSAASVCPSTQNQILLKKKKKVKSKSQISPFQWLQSYFQTDPDFHENLSQQTTIPMGRRNSAGSISGRNHLNSVGSASGIGRAGSVEKGFYVGSLDSKYTPHSDDEDDCPDVDLHSPLSSGAVKKTPILMEFHHLNRPPFPNEDSTDETISIIKIASFNKPKNDFSLSFGTSPVEKALSNIVDIGTQLSSVSPARNKEFTYESDSDHSISQSNAAALLTKNNCRPVPLDTSNCDDKSPNVATSLPRVALGKSSPPSNERTISIGSSNNSNSMDHLCLPYSNMHLKPQSTLDDDHDDFYSSICDNQLSFNNSPCKSPRSLSDITDLKPAITHKFRSSPSTKVIADVASAASTVASSRKNIHRRDGIVIAKPVESHSIGFNVELTSATTNSTPQTTEKYNMDVDCDDEIPVRRKSPVDSSSLNLIIVKSDGVVAPTTIPLPVNDGGDVGDDTDCGIGDVSPNTSKTGCGDGGSSSSSGYLCASEGSQSVSSTSIGVSSSGTAFSLERNSLDGGTSSGVESNSKKKLSLPTPEIEVGDFGITKNRSSSVSNNNNHNNISSFLASSLSSSSSSSGSSIDNDKH